MADQQGRPDDEPQGIPAAAESTPPAVSGMVPPAPPAKKQPGKAAKKSAPAKKATKKTPAEAAKKAAPAKKAPAKKAPAKKAPSVAPVPPDPGRPVQPAGANADLTSAAEEAAAHAKSTVASAPNPVSGPAPVSLIGPEPSRLPIAAAIAAGVLAVLVVLLARRNSHD